MISSRRGIYQRLAFILPSFLTRFATYKNMQFSSLKRGVRGEGSIVIFKKIFLIQYSVLCICIFWYVKCRLLYFKSPSFIYNVKWKGLKNKTSKFENNILSRKHTPLDLKNSSGSKSLHCSCDKLQWNSLKKNQVVA